MWIAEKRQYIIGIFTFLGIASFAALPFLKFSFDFEDSFLMVIQIWNIIKNSSRNLNLMTTTF